MVGKKVLFLTVVFCAVMAAAATPALSAEYLAPLPGDKGNAPPEYAAVLSGEDYLVSGDEGVVYTDALADGELFLVKRISELKSALWIPDGNSGTVYTKVAYAVNLKLRDISAFAGVTGMAVSNLVVEGFGSKAPTLISAILSINGVPVTLKDSTELLPDSNYMSREYVYDAAAGTGVLSVQFWLPSLDATVVGEYLDEDAVSIFVMFRTPEPVTITGSEVGFPDYQTP